MSKAKKLAGVIGKNIPFTRVELKKIDKQTLEDNDLPKSIKFYQLSLEDLDQVNSRLKDTDLWGVILGIVEETGGVEPETDEEAMRQSLKFLKNLNYGVQLHILWQSLKHWDENITLADADAILSYGIREDDRAAALMYVLMNVEESEIEARAGESKKGASKKATSGSKEGQ